VSLAHVEARVSEALAARNSADASTPKRERAGRGGPESLFVIVILVAITIIKFGLHMMVR